MNRKVKGIIFICIGLFLGIFYTFGTIADYYNDDAIVLEWELFVILPVFIIALVLSLILVFIGLKTVTSPELSLPNQDIDKKEFGKFVEKMSDVFKKDKGETSSEE